MDNESTTTDAPQAEVTDQQTLPTENNLENTSTQSETTQVDGQQEVAESTPTFDSDLDEWAAKTGRSAPTTDRERELYQEIRDSQREYTRTRQSGTARHDVEKTLREVEPEPYDKQGDGEYDPYQEQQNRLERMFYEERANRLRGEFFHEHNVTSEQADMMGQILKEKIDKGGRAAYDFWTNPDNLGDWYMLAKARLATEPDLSSVEAEAARAERERIAKESQAAAASPRSASITQTQKPAEYDRAAYFASDDY